MCWEELEEKYAPQFSRMTGPIAKPVRVELGALFQSFRAPPPIVFGRTREGTRDCIFGSP